MVVYCRRFLSALILVSGLSGKYCWVWRKATTKLTNTRSPVDRWNKTRWFHNSPNGIKIREQTEPYGVDPYFYAQKIGTPSKWNISNEIPQKTPKHGNDTNTRPEEPLS